MEGIQGQAHLGLCALKVQGDRINAGGVRDQLGEPQLAGHGSGDTVGDIIQRNTPLGGGVHEGAFDGQFVKPQRLAGRVVPESWGRILCYSV